MITRTSRKMPRRGWTSSNWSPTWPTLRPCKRCPASQADAHMTHGVYGRNVLFRGLIQGRSRSMPFTIAMVSFFAPDSFRHAFALCVVDNLHQTQVPKPPAKAAPGTRHVKARKNTKAAHSAVQSSGYGSGTPRVSKRAGRSAACVPSYGDSMNTI